VAETPVPADLAEQIRARLATEPEQAWDAVLWNIVHAQAEHDATNGADA
jgi:hypothetical protein